MKSASGPGVLLVGGYRTTRDALRGWLVEEFPDIRVRIAESAEGARRIVQAKPFAAAVILVDIDRGGLEMLRLVRQLTPGAPLIALSAYRADSHREYAIAADAVACVSSQVLNGALKEVLRPLLEIPAAAS